MGIDLGNANNVESDLDRSQLSRQEAMILLMIMITIIMMCAPVRPIDRQEDRDLCIVRDFQEAEHAP